MANKKKILIEYQGKRGCREYYEKINENDKIREKRESRWKSNLRNFLRSRVGQRWDFIYQEICEKHTSQFDRFKIDYLINFVVDFDIRKEGDRFFDSKGMELTGRFSEYFLVAQDGILYYLNRREKYKRRKPQPRIVRLDGTTYYKYGEIWYRIKYEDLREKFAGKDHNSIVYWLGNDVFGNGGYQKKKIWMILDDFRRIYGESIYVTHKEQANKNEIRRIAKEIRQKS